MYKMQTGLCRLVGINVAGAPANLEGQVSPALVQQLESIGSLARFSPGERIMVEGEAGEGIYLLRLGAVRLSVATGEGDVVMLRTLAPGAFVGLSSTLSCDHCCYTVEAIEPSEFTFVPARAAQELLRTRPDLCLQIVQLLGQEMSSLCNERAAVNARKRPVRSSS